jgi:curved DNA-binding protein CbpA
MQHQLNSAELNAHFLELEGVLDQVERAFNHYQVLGVERSATNEEIGEAYRKLLRLLKPTDGRHDKLPYATLERIEETRERMQEAMAVLSSFGRRVEYDNSLRQKTAPLPLNPRVLSQAQKQSGPQPPVETKQAPEPEPAQTCEAVSIKNYSAGQAVFTKKLKKGDNRRKYQRLKLSVPAWLIGHDRSGEKWKEMTETVDVSIGGVALQTSRELREGAVVHLTMPFPVKLRRHGYSEPTYQVYAVVRRIASTDDGEQVLGLEFVGSSPPPGYLKKPWAKFTVRY